MDIACSMSSTSEPRTSPTMIRSGRIRSELLQQVALGDLAFALEVGRSGFQAHHVGLLQRSSAESSIVTIRSSSGTKLVRQLSIVVLPEPVPPQTRRLSRARTTAWRNSAISVVSVPLRSRSSMVSGWRPKRRMDKTGPSTASGGMIALTREPSGSRASTIGEDSSTRRPTLAYNPPDHVEQMLRRPGNSRRLDTACLCARCKPGWRR